MQIAPAHTVSLADALHRLRDTPWIAALPVGASTVGALVDKCARFEWDGAHLRPMYGFANAANAITKRNPRLLDAVSGAIRYAGRFADAEHPQLRPIVDGVSLAPDFDADVVQALATTLVDSNWLPSERRNASDEEELRSTLAWHQGDPNADNGTISRDGGSAHADGAWLSVGYGHSSDLDKLSARTRLTTPEQRSVAAGLAGLFQHELEHRITPWTSEHEIPSWLEEGTAELTTNRDELNFEAAAAMGMRTSEPSRATGGYPTFERNLKRLVSLAGVDPRDTAAVTQLLQAPVADEVLPGIARAVIAHHKLTGYDADRVRIAIENLHDSRGDEDAATSYEPKAPHLTAAIDRIVRMTRGAKRSKA